MGRRQNPVLEVTATEARNVMDPQLLLHVSDTIILGGLLVLFWQLRTNHKIMMTLLFQLRDCHARLMELEKKAYADLAQQTAYKTNGE